VNEQRTLSVMAYAPDTVTPEVNLNNDGLLLIDA
jgi:hypothetical protein